MIERKEKEKRSIAIKKKEKRNIMVIIRKIKIRCR